jgi:hypothetical protein
MYPQKVPVRDDSMNQMRRYGGILALLLSAQAQSPACADFQSDSLALFGAWRWVSTRGGMFRTNEVPPPTGWSRTLVFRTDRTYAYWEQDSVGSYIIYSGKFTVHRSRHSRIEDAPEVSLWVELEGWGWTWDDKQLVAFYGSNGILMYPGSEEGTMVFRVSDALRTAFNRDSTWVEPKGPPGGARTKPP